MDSFTIERNDRIFTTAEAHIISAPSDLPREIASALPESKINDSYLWIAGRFVQAGIPNKNGHFWTVADLEYGNESIKYTPMNALHQWSRPVGTFVDSKIVNRAIASDESHPEIQALGVVWSANFPQMASVVKQAYADKKLWFSMECVAESKECLACGKTYEWGTPNEMACEHMSSSKTAPRRLINPTFVGGALIFPPESPAWRDADITEVAKDLTIAYTDSTLMNQNMTLDEWNEMMEIVTAPEI